MAIDKSKIALKDDATAGYLNVQDPALISKVQDNETKKEVVSSIEALETGKQDALISGTNIKTINGNTVLGSGDLTTGDLLASNDLSDLASVATARTNLDVYSKAETNSLVGGTSGYVTLEDYGAVGDGVTDDTAAIQAALNSGFPIAVLQKTYLITSTVLITTGAFMFGYGFKSKFLTTSNITMFDIAGLNVANITIDSINFSGNRVGAAQKGIVCSGTGAFQDNYNIKISNCDFRDFSFAIQSTFNGSGNYKTVFTLQQCYFDNNFSGFQAGERGEYHLLDNCSFNGNDFGVNFFGGGNNSMIGGQITNGGTGFKVNGGTNDGHAMAVGVKINHNTINVEANAVSLHYLFSSCMFYAGKILVTSSTGIRFDSCEFGNWDLEVTNSNLTAFSNCMYQTNPTILIDTANTNTINRGAIFRTGNKVPFLLNDDELKDKVGTVVSFERAYQHGYPTAETGNITFDFTRAVSGLTQTMRHNSGTKPTMPAEANKLSGDYVVSVDNQIYFTPILESAGVWRVDVTVSQDSAW